METRRAGDFAPVAPSPRRPLALSPRRPLALSPRRPLSPRRVAPSPRLPLSFLGLPLHIADPIRDVKCLTSTSHEYIACIVASLRTDDCCVSYCYRARLTVSERDSAYRRLNVYAVSRIKLLYGYCEGVLTINKARYAYIEACIDIIFLQLSDSEAQARGRERRAHRARSSEIDAAASNVEHSHSGSLIGRGKDIRRG